MPTQEYTSSTNDTKIKTFELNKTKQKNCQNALTKWMQMLKKGLSNETKKI